jgi:NAD(P)-dependent dehydrogenase (short-subunit alcohol dehydrogenase family)
MDKIKKKVVLITGGSRGIGKAAGKAFARNGFQVALVSKNPENLINAQEEFQAEGLEAGIFQCDAGEISQVKRTVENIYREYSGIDVLINNAGLSKLTPLEAEDYAAWQEIININLAGAYYFSREVFLKMKQQNSGRIINISSVYGLTGGEGYSAYCASKHGLIGLTRALALEMAKNHITVNAICPGWVETDMFEHDMDELSNFYGLDRDIIIAEEKIAVPLKKFTTVEEVADLALYLASNSAKNITGESINISGGLAI